MIVELAERGSAYIRYRIGDRPAGATLEVGGEGSEVMADMNASGDVIGIEIVDVAIGQNVERARAFAIDRGLSFPKDISGAARAAAAAPRPMTA